MFLLFLGDIFVRRYSSSGENIDLTRDGGVLPVPIPFGKYYLLEKIATGGMAGLIAPYAPSIKDVDPHLTLEGLRLIHERNS